MKKIDVLYAMSIHIYAFIRSFLYSKGMDKQKRYFVGFFNRP
ncbi:hypothetical protein FUAX_41570 (plasmid) [Fulvitalea axinellae]|uniref:Uncharacterized protein n=1 Tax=Fulvitalea axinellae TaxID=1182444 RepID=A0AAU9DKE5_9BACT|nr:hypothetical protein FUAX_41570 [Fulvitalea axinellae]